MLCFLSPFEGFRGGSWGQLGVQNGAKLGHLGAMLEHLGAMLGYLGASWGYVGASWSFLEAF